MKIIPAPRVFVIKFIEVIDIKRVCTAFEKSENITTLLLVEIKYCGELLANAYNSYYIGHKKCLQKALQKIRPDFLFLLIFVCGIEGRNHQIQRG